jgi:hypothetical protein
VHPAAIYWLDTPMTIKKTASAGVAYTRIYASRSQSEPRVNPANIRSAQRFAVGANVRIPRSVDATAELPVWLDTEAPKPMASIKIKPQYPTTCNTVRLLFR